MSLISKIAKRADILIDYCQERGYNTSIAIFIDLARHSGRNRFVVWDFNSHKPLLVAPVSHGSGSDKSHIRSAYAHTSNQDGSHLSSLGRALIAERYTGSYGIAYRLDGLDSTNSNIRPRCIVLHGWRHTTSYPIWPLATTGSFGCPVLSTRNMARIDRMLQGEDKVVIETFM